MRLPEQLRQSEQRSLVGEERPDERILAQAARRRETARKSNGGGSAHDANDLLSYLKKHPGAKSDQISAAFSTDANTLRPVMRTLIDDGKVRTEGQKRGTLYFAGV